jgi:hypothetical protein
MGPAPLEGFAMMRLALLLIAISLAFTVTPLRAEERQTLIVVVGAEGTPEYGQEFRTWAERWSAAAEQAGAECVLIGLEEMGSEDAVDGDKASDADESTRTKTDREVLEESLRAHSQGSSAALWLVLIGHGTYDGKTARFNLRGPDISAEDLQLWLKQTDRPVAIANCASCSGPFLAKLSGPSRVILTATKSGHEYNYARFGDYLSAAITDPAADLDKDEQTSLLEAYLVAAAKVREFYATESRLATEHALLDDNGDGLGTPGEFFQGVRPIKAAKDNASLDGTLSGQFVLVRSEREAGLSNEIRNQRDALERELAKLRTQRQTLGDDEYLALIEPILIKLARLSLAVDAGEDTPADHCAPADLKATP